MENTESNKLKLRICSDVHLEFSGGDMEFPPLPNDKDTILVLAGDIGIASRPASCKEWIEDMSMRFRAVIVVLGNHEHYHGNFPTSKQKMIDMFCDCPNVDVLDKETVIFDGVAFICATMWTSMNNMDPLLMLDVVGPGGMNDYAIIRTGPTAEPWKRKLTPQDTVSDHINAVQYIFDEIPKQKAAGNKVVVVTHQGPSLQSVDAAYVDSALNGAYVSNLDDKILEHPYDLHIHGHTHVSFDYMIGSTRILCNPRGYFGRDLNPEFDPLLVVEI